MKERLLSWEEAVPFFWAYAVVLLAPVVYPTLVPFTGGWYFAISVAGIQFGLRDPAPEPAKVSKE